MSKARITSQSSPSFESGARHFIQEGNNFIATALSSGDGALWGLYDLEGDCVFIDPLPLKDFIERLESTQWKGLPVGTIITIEV